MQRSIHASTLAAFAALTLLTPKAFASAQEFNYDLTRIPPALGDCHELAKSIGEKFASVTGLKVRRSICAAQRELGNDVVVTYMADEPVVPVSTLDYAQGVDTRGAFSTENECNVALKREIERFETATSLTPLIAYCFADKYASDYLYAMRVDAFGKAARAPFVSRTLVFGRPVNRTVAELESASAKRLLDAGVDLSFIRYEDDAGFGRFMLLHYATERRALDVPDFGRVDTEAQCLAEVRQLDDAFKGRTDAPIVTYCAADDVLAELLPAGVFFGAPALDIGFAAESFTSYEACVNGRKDLISYYRSIGRPVVGGICGHESASFDRRWSVVLLENRE